MLVIRILSAGLGLLFTLLLSHSGVAHSQSITVLPIGERTTLVERDSGDKISSTFYGKRSYCCSMLVESSYNLPSFISAEGFQGLSAASLIGRGEEGEKLCRGNSESCQNRRQCWYEDPQNSASSSRRLIIEQPELEAIDTDVLCQETTLVGGFNTVVTDFNFLELSATSRGTNSQSITGFILIRQTLTQTSITLPFSLSFANGSQTRQDISIHDSIGNANDFGQIIIIHNGAPNSVIAKLSQYRVTSAIPLEFEPVLQEVFVPRVE